MPAPISVIVPTLNSAASLVQLLADLTQGVQSGLVREVIFADGGSTDETGDIAEGVGAVFVQTEPGRGVQLQAACTQAKGMYLLILHSDCSLSETWTDTLGSLVLQQTPYAHFGNLSFDAIGIAPNLVAGWANLRSKIFGLPYGDQGIFLPRTLYMSVGGYQAIPLMEDVALARALKGHLRPMAVTVTTSAARYQREGWLRRGTGNLVLLLRYALGAPPERLARAYRHR